MNISKIMPIPLAALSLMACSDLSPDSASNEQLHQVTVINAYTPGSGSLKKAVATTYTDDTQNNAIVVKWDTYDSCTVTGNGTAVFKPSDIDDGGEAAKFIVMQGSVSCSDAPPCTAVYPEDKNPDDLSFLANSQTARSTNKYENLKNYAVMSGTVKPSGDGEYAVHFEQRTALVDLTFDIGEMQSFVGLGIMGPNQEKYWAKFPEKTTVSTASAIVVVPPFLLEANSDLTVFWVKQINKTLSYNEYSRQLKNTAQFKAGGYYALHVDNSYSPKNTTSQPSAASITAYLPEQGTVPPSAVALRKMGNITTVATTYSSTNSEIKVAWKTEAGEEKFRVYQIDGFEDNLPQIPSDAQFTEYTSTSVNSDGEATFQMSADGTDPAEYCNNEFEDCRAFYPSSDVWPQTSSQTTLSDRIKDKLSEQSYETMEKNLVMEGFENYDFMMSAITFDGTRTVVNFEHLVAAVEINLPPITVNVKKVGIMDGDNSYAAVFDTDVSKDVPIKALVAVTPVTLRDEVKLFVEDVNGNKYIYAKKLTSEKTLQKGSYYTFDFTNVVGSVDGVPFVSMGETCGGIWAKEDFVKDGKGKFTGSIDSASSEVYYVKNNILDSLSKSPSKLIGLDEKWQVPSPADFTALLTTANGCYDENSDGKIFRHNGFSMEFSVPNDGYWTNIKDSGKGSYFHYNKYTQSNDAGEIVDVWKWNQKTGVSAVQIHRIHLIFKP